MTSSTQQESIAKTFLRSGWRATLLAHAILSSVIPRSRAYPRLYYGGARSGNLGGPLVKVKRLQQFFPQYRWNYNLVYLLSNAPYLPSASLNWLKRFNIPLVLNQNGVFYPGWYAGNWQKQNAIMADAYHQADHVFWQSEFCRHSADRFLGPRKGNGEVLFNAIDIQQFSPAKVKLQRPTTFLLTGKIGGHLGYRLASTIEGFALACRSGLDARLIIAGWIENMADARSMVEKYHVTERVRFLGAYTQAEAPQIYREADAYVMTKYLDPCPNTVIEAMACGLPVLYSASGGVPELVGNEAGISLPVPEDWEKIHVPEAEAIADGMLRIADTIPIMGQAARARAETCFDIRSWIERHRVVFEHLLRI